MDALCNIVFTLFFFSALGCSIYCRVFWAQLRKQHADTWESLGGPLIIWSPKFVRFLWSRRYEDLRDQKTVTSGRFLRSLFIFSVIFGVLAIAAMAFVVCTHGLPDGLHK